MKRRGRICIARPIVSVTKALAKSPCAWPRRRQTQPIALPPTGRFNFMADLALPMIAMRACIAARRYFMRRNLAMRHGNAQSWLLCCLGEWASCNFLTSDNHCTVGRRQVTRPRSRRQNAFGRSIYSQQSSGSRRHFQDGKSLPFFTMYL